MSRSTDAEFLEAASTGQSHIVTCANAMSQIMGAFASEEWRHSGGQYYGTGESFLFRFQPKFEAFRWSRKNIYCMVGMDGFVGMGGDGAFGLQLTKPP